jgi:hypothetical protein
LIHQLVTVSALQNLKPKEILKLVESIENDLLDISESKKLSEVIGQGGLDAIASDNENGDGGFAYTAFVEAGIEIGRQLGLTVDQPHLLVNGRVSTGDWPIGRRLTNSSWVHSLPLLFPGKISLLSKPMNIGNEPSQSSTCSRPSMTTCPPLIELALQTWSRAFRR